MREKNAPAPRDLPSAAALTRYLAVVLLAFIVGAFGVGGVAWLLDRHTSAGKEVLLPILLVYGVVTLLVALASLVAILAHFGLAAPGAALGLPEGTVQAVIALVLVLIFAITAVFLLTIDVGSGPNEVSERLATQILTTAGTLAVAVAGFYFGTRAVEAGVSAGAASVQPKNTSPPAVAGIPRVGETLRAEVGGWTGSPAPNYGHQWQRKPGSDPEWTDIRGANVTAYLVTIDDVGQTIRVAVTATNAAGEQTAYSLATAEVMQVPTQKTPPEVTGEPRVDVELRGSEGTWTAWPPEPVSYSYQWERTPADRDDWHPIEGAQASSYRVTPADIGTRLRLSVTATNPAGAGQPAQSTPTQPVTQPPTNTVPPTVEGLAQEAGTLTARRGEWTGWPPPEFAYQWQRQPAGSETWEDIPGASGEMYPVTSSDVESRLRVVVRASSQMGEISAASEPSTQVEASNAGQ
jgi:hypothetical protein